MSGAWPRGRRCCCVRCGFWRRRCRCCCLCGHRPMCAGARGRLWAGAGHGECWLVVHRPELGMPAGMASVVLQTQAFFTMLLAALLMVSGPSVGSGWAWAWRPVAWAWIARRRAMARPALRCWALFSPWARRECGRALELAHARGGTPRAVRAGVVHCVDERVPGAAAVAAGAVAGRLGCGAAAVAAQRLARGGRRRLAGEVWSTPPGYGLWTRLLQRHAASTVAPLSLLVPVIGLVSAMVARASAPPPCNGWGTLAVLLGMVINQLGGVWARRRR